MEPPPILKRWASAPNGTGTIYTAYSAEAMFIRLRTENR